MGKIAFVFSGQGAQHAGMGEDFYNNNSAVRELFDDAQKIRCGTIEQCFTGDAETLKCTDNTQPCLYLADLGAALAMRDAGINPDAVAGFSLGEIPALAFAGAYTYLEGFRLACERGKAMAKAAEKTDASMVAVVKLENSVVEEICSHYSQVYPVNYNSDGQLVVSGAKSELADFSAEIKTAGGRAIPLAVGGGFHSPFMNDASEEFGEVLEDATIKSPKLTVYANETAQPYCEDVKVMLKRQINHPVKWCELIKNMANDGFDTFIEVGVGNTLQKLISKILPEAKSFKAETMEDVINIAKECGVNA